MKTTHLIFGILFIASFTILNACGGGGSGGDGNGDDNGDDISESFNGSLSGLDGDIDGIYNDVYIIKEVPAGTTIWVRVDPTGFDAVVTLYYGGENDGEIIQEEDSNDMGAAESFSVTAGEAGQYVIFVSSFEAGETGSYTLNYTVNKKKRDEEDEDDEADDGGEDDDDDDDDTCHSQDCGVCGHFNYLSCSCEYDYYCSVR